jgi:hypothetical protein
MYVWLDFDRLTLPNVELHRHATDMHAELYSSVENHLCFGSATFLWK